MLMAQFFPKTHCYFVSNVTHCSMLKNWGFFFRILPKNSLHHHHLPFHHLRNWLNQKKFSTKLTPPHRDLTSPNWINHSPKLEVSWFSPKKFTNTYHAPNWIHQSKFTNLKIHHLAFTKFQIHQNDFTKIFPHQLWMTVPAAIDEISKCEIERQSWVLEFVSMKDLIKKRLVEIH